VLSADYAGALLQALGDVESVDDRVRDVERWLDPSAPASEMIVGNMASFHRLPGQIAIYRAGQALIQGDVDGTMHHARRALDLLPEGDHLGRGSAAGLLGLSFWTSGDLEEGHRMYTECMALLRQAGFISDLFGCSLALADIRITQGRLHDAMATYERALTLTNAPGALPLRGTADMHVGMSGIYWERNDLEAAFRHLQISAELGDHIGLRQNPYRWRVAIARVLEAQGDLDGALDLLLEAERLHDGDFFPNVRPVPAMSARLRVAKGRMGEALAWAHEYGLTVFDELSYLHEYEHITLARILLARYRTDGDQGTIEEVTGFLSRLFEAAEEGERTGNMIEILILQALMHEARGDLDAALASLERALALAEPEGYVRSFIGEGEPMKRLLSEADGRGIMPDYTKRLRAAFVVGASVPAATPPRTLPDPLTGREMEVLRLIADGLSNREIADRLYLALDTVKGHNRRIFAKLGVQRRTEALSRARKLGLL
jgi:LuxR family maltose regulon positive regulatory protein